MEKLDKEKLITTLTHLFNRVEITMTNSCKTF